MVVLISLLLMAFVFMFLKWVWARFNLQARLSMTAIGTGWTVYGIVGALIPHPDPQLWHYVTAPAVGGLVLILGWTLVKARGA